MRGEGAGIEGQREREKAVRGLERKREGSERGGAGREGQRETEKAVRGDGQGERDREKERMQ